MSKNYSELDEIIKEVGRRYGAICALKIIKRNRGSETILIAFLMGEKREERDFHKIFEEISDKLKLTNIDLIILNDAPLTICYGILKEYEVVYCDNKEKLKAFKAQITEKYLDFREEVRGHTEISLKKAKEIESKI